MPGFNIGPDSWHLDLFVEYERTFGRGKAFAITHNPISSPTYEKEKCDYLELAGQMPSVVHKGTETDCRNLIEQLRRYRDIHPNLFDDVSANKPNSGKVVWKEIH